MKCNLQVIRHAQTVANQKRLYYGATDVDISEIGEEEIAIYKKDGIYNSAKVHFTTGLLRTTRTLRLIEGDEVCPIAIDNLREFNFGDFEMFSHDELMSNEKYVEWIEDQTNAYVIPNGESKEGFEQRMEKGISELISQMYDLNEERYMLVAHGGPISFFAIKFLGFDPMNMYNSMPGNGRGYSVDFEITDNDVKVLDWKHI